MKDTARRADHQRKHRGPVRAGFAMYQGDIEKVRQDHSSSIFEVKVDQYQAVCACGWLSAIHYYEHVDLLRAMHAHAVVTFGVYA